MQLTVRVPRLAATFVAIVVAVAAVAVVLPATAASDSVIRVCVDPTSLALTVDPACTGSLLTWNQAGVPGPAGATGAVGPAGPAGKATVAAVHLNTSKPALVARIESNLLVQAGVLTDVNDTVRRGLAASRAAPPSIDPAVTALRTQVELQAVSLNRLVNVLRALSKTQSQLLQGLE